MPSTAVVVFGTHEEICAEGELSNCHRSWRDLSSKERACTGPCQQTGMQRLTGRKQHRRRNMAKQW